MSDPHHPRLRYLAVLASLSMLVGAAAIGGLAVFAGGGTTCTGEIGTILSPTTIKGDLTVPSGASCILHGDVTITHDVIVLDGGTLQLQKEPKDPAFTVTVMHDVRSSGVLKQYSILVVGHDMRVTAPGGGSIQLGYYASVSVGHDFSMRDAAYLNLFDATIGHDLQIQGLTEVFEVGNSTVGHNLTAKQNAYAGVYDTWVGHDLTIRDNDVAEVTDNAVGHKASCTDNAVFTGSGNTPADAAASCN